MKLKDLTKKEATIIEGGSFWGKLHAIVEGFFGVCIEEEAHKH